MPAWLIIALLKYVLPLVIQYLQKAGYIDAAEALVVKGAVDIYMDVKSINIYSAPTDFPNSPNPNPTPNNLVVKQPEE